MRNKWSTVFGTLQNQEIGMVKNRLKYAPLICISTKKKKKNKKCYIHTFKEQNDMQRLSSRPEKMNSFMAPATILG